MKPNSRLIVGLLCLGLGLLGIDAAVKFWVHHTLPLVSASSFSYPYGGVGVFSKIFGIQFSIVHATNTGAVWGIFASYPMLLLLFRLVLIGGLIVYLVRKVHTRSLAIPLVMIIAGALGNVIDIFFYGHVVDMFFFRFWGWPYPVFNVADASIFVGAALLLLQSLRKSRKVQVCE